MPALLVAVSLAAAPPAAAELYKWVDEQGGVHFTENLSEVPPEQRPRADQEALERDRQPMRNWNRLDVEIAPAAAPPARRARKSATGPGRVHHIQVERAGAELQLGVELNDGLVVPFKADTGAMINTIPMWAAQQLGFELDEDTPTTQMVGVSGKPMKVGLMVVRSVRIGTVHVEDVEMAVVPTMQYGLLGMPFFNNFRVQIDPAAGEMVLEELDMTAVEGVYGGLNETEWRRKFRAVRARQDKIDDALERVPSSYTSWIERLEREREQVEIQLEHLEERAQRAGVPHDWRE